jgi:PAS domain S-box-containing protein
MHEKINTEYSTSLDNDIELTEADQVLENATEAFHIISPRGIIVWANKKELELLGYSKDEYIGHHISEFYTDRFVINDILCRLIYNQEVVNYPAELLKKDGTTIQVLLNSNLYKKEGAFNHIRSSTRDITELKLFEIRLQNSNAKVLNQLLTANTLINLLTSTTWKTDQNGKITYWQSRWQTYTGQSEQDQLEYGWLKAIHPQDRIALKADLIASIKEHHDLRKLVRVFSKQANDYVYCGIYATPVLELQEHGFEWVFVLVDQTKVIPLDIMPV